MSNPMLVIGNKNYSSWSLRPWLAMRVGGIDFDEKLIEFGDFGPEWQTAISEFSPTKKVPLLIDGDIKVWESLAILEYLADKWPEKNLWPTDIAARTMARSVSAEMHAGFGNLRTYMPMNIRASHPGVNLDKQGVMDDVNRVCAIWNEAREKFGNAGNGDFLFGHFTNADAMFAPIVSRLTTHAVQVDPVSRSYMDAILAIPAMIEWSDAGRAEKAVVSMDEV
ncbi:MAG: glutathione S-transferase family protein [Rhodospirillaceae bacterium]|nr:glutathione S-transferase family protein [Rhodospirillaceae bacterium]